MVAEIPDMESSGSDDMGESGADTEGGESTGGMGVEPQDYYDGEPSALLGGVGNESRCSTCHSTDGTLAGYCGESMKDIAYLENYKGGDADLLGAVNACVTGWMGGTALVETDAAFIALVEFFEGISDMSVTTPNSLMPEVLADEAAYEVAYAEGNAMAGADKYEAACAVCHDDALMLGPIPSPSKEALGAYSIGRIAQQVRTSGPPPSGTDDGGDSTPGPMPFFEPEELSAEDLADIIAHLKAG